MALQRDIVLVGSGNVATHLARAIEPRLAAVLSRDVSHARELAFSLDKSGAISYGTPDVLRGLNPSIVILSVADHALKELAANIGYLPGNPLVLHTSGTIDKEALCPMSPRTGVLYPLQTFSKAKEVDMSRVPFFTEASNAEDLTITDALASSISPTVNHADETSRRKLHIAGVFASNFPNILYEITGKILASAGYNLETVRPLVEAMTAKAFDIGPHAAQTGPARRGDTDVINSHIAALPKDKAEIYRVLSDYIIASHKDNGKQ